MSSKPINRASGSEGDSQPPVDERKRKRMLSNRESARRSRMRKQQHLDDLISQGDQLKNDNGLIEMQINLLTQQYMNVETENTALRTQLRALTERLRSLNAVLEIAEEVSGMAMDIPEIPDPLLKPWQLPCPAQPIMATADIFQF